MATDAENAAAVYSAALAAQAAALANPQPNYTVDGISVNWSDYYKMLGDAVEQARKNMLAAQGPYTVVSVAR